MQLTPEAILRRTRAAFPEEQWRTPERLEGGSINDVYRLRSPNRTVIAKHAPPHVAANPQMPLSAARIAFEARALQAFQPGGPLAHLARDDFRPPKCLHHDAENALLFLEDVAPCAPLANVVTAENGNEFGTRLGAFIGGLHRQTYGASAWRDFCNEPIQRTRLAIQYQPATGYLCEGLARIGLRSLSDGERATADRNFRQLGEQLVQTGCCLTMGDLWLPSLLVGERSCLRLIDWEFAHFGLPLQDYAHFGAHCWMAWLVHRDQPTNARAYRSLWQGFAQAYGHALADQMRSLWPNVAKRLANLHFAAELIMRLAGPFAQSGPFASLAERHPIRREALTTARVLATRVL